MHARCILLSEIDHFAVSESSHVSVMVLVLRHVFLVELLEIFDAEDQIERRRFL